ncbi:MAG: hypothetical protein KBD01_10625, partial [Acidobacteria bacterium]|nr:hypothetical protein [Acidobacteriota bacterium]
MNAARTALLVAACAALGAGPARAVKLPGLGPAADREALRALRGAELEDATRGGWQPTPEFREALGRLPEKCRGEVPGAPDCDDELRCAWLGARAAALLAWSGGGAGERAAAAARLHRLANRIAAGGACGRGEERARWERDRAAAEVDDATAHLALLRELPDIAGAPLVGAADQAPLAALRRARGPAPPEALRALRRALHEAVQHETWLAAQPVLARLRAGLQQAWAEYGGVPGDCGAELLRVDLLEDQWRGYLVREVVPQALECLALRNTRERARRGAPADPALAQRLARDLAASARADEGGRSFGASRAALAGLDELLAAVSSAPAGTALA